MPDASPVQPVRTARCVRHGRIYDTRARAGCPACAAEAQASPARWRSTRGARRGLLPIVLIGAWAAMTWALPDWTHPLPGGDAAPAQDADTRGEPGATPEPVRPGIDATPYRSRIEPIEDVLYRPSTPKLEDPERVGALAMQLGEQLYADLGPLAGHRALTEVVAFASEASAGSEIGYATPSLDGSRASWEALRSRLFAPAAWFRRTDAALVAAQRPTPIRAGSRELLALRSFADEVEAMIAGGRHDLLRHGEPLVDAAEGSREERELAARFRYFAEEWDARVGALGGRIPPQPALDGEQHVLFAYQALGQALHQLRIATTPVGDSAVPMKWWRTQCLDAAAARLAEARDHLKGAARLASLP